MENRPNHPDFMFSSELKNISFSGIRDNKLAQLFEVWITGEIVVTATYQEVMLDRNILDKRQKEYFRLL